MKVDRCISTKRKKKKLSTKDFSNSKLEITARRLIALKVKFVFFFGRKVKNLIIKKCIRSSQQKSNVTFRLIKKRLHKTGHKI